MPPEEYEYVDITNDGTVKLNHDFYESREQLMYPSEISTTAIKYLWLRKEQPPNLTHIEEQKFGFQLLPQEAKFQIEEAERIFTHIYDALERGHNYTEFFDNLDYWIDFLSYTEHTEQVNYLKKIEKYGEGAISEEDSSLFEDPDISGNEWGQTKVLGSGTIWIKVPIEQFKDWDMVKYWRKSYEN